MSIELSDEKKAQLAEMMGFATPMTDQREPEPKAPDVVEQTRTESQPENRDSGSPPPPKEEPEDKIRPVPYRVHAQTQRERTEFKSNYEKEKARADELEAKYQAFAKKQDPEEDWLKKYLAEDTNDREDKQDVPAVDSQLQARLDRLEAIEAERDLARYLADAAREYPDLPEAVILASLDKGVTDIVQIASSWDYLGQQWEATRDKRNPPPESKRNDVAPRLQADKGKYNAPEPMPQRSMKEKAELGWAMLRNK